MHRHIKNDKDVQWYLNEILLASPLSKVVIVIPLSCLLIAIALSYNQRQITSYKPMIQLNDI